MKVLMPIENLDRRLHVGDCVVVREDLEAYKYYPMLSGHDIGVVPDMLTYKGQTARIAWASSSRYNIKEDGGCWNWTDGMFSGVYVDIKDLGDINTADNLSMMSLFGGA